MIKTKVHSKLSDNEILNPNRKISPLAELVYVSRIGKYVYKGDATCFTLEELGADMRQYNDFISGS